MYMRIQKTLKSEIFMTFLKRKFLDFFQNFYLKKIFNKIFILKHVSKILILKWIFIFFILLIKFINMFIRITWKVI